MVLDDMHQNTRAHARACAREILFAHMLTVCWVCAERKTRCADRGRVAWCCCRVACCMEHVAWSMRPRVAPSAGVTASWDRFGFAAV